MLHKLPITAGQSYLEKEQTDRRAFNYILSYRDHIWISKKKVKKHKYYIFLFLGSFF